MNTTEHQGGRFRAKFTPEQVNHVMTTIPIYTKSDGEIEWNRMWNQHPELRDWFPNSNSVKGLYFRQRHLAKYGHGERRRKTPGKATDRFSDAQKRKAMKMLNDGYSYAQVMDVIGTSRHSLNLWKRSGKYDKPAPKPAHELIREDREGWDDTEPEPAPVKEVGVNFCPHCGTNLARYK